MILEQIANQRSRIAMGNLIDYMHEFADVPFSESPFTEADNLALSQLAYCDLSSAVPALGTGDGIPFPIAWRTYLQARRKGGARHSADSSERVFEAMANSKRYAAARLAWFEQRADEATHGQFAAYTALLPDGTAYVAFRGTDSRISAWRENFMMSYMVVDAQSGARRYLNTVSRFVPGPLRVGGHSKGGNLAAFAAATCSQRVKPRVVEVWCNDSPGFVREVVDFDALVALDGRARLFVPEFCVVARIMEQPFTPTVVRAVGNRYLQHDPLNWKIDHGALVRGTQLNPACRRVGRIFHWLIYSHSRRERVEIVNDLFDALALAGITRIYDFAGKQPTTIVRIFARYRDCRRQTQRAVKGVLVPLARVEAGAAMKRALAEAAYRFGEALSPAKSATNSPESFAPLMKPSAISGTRG